MSLEHGVITDARDVIGAVVRHLLALGCRSCRAQAVCVRRTAFAVSDLLHTQNKLQVPIKQSLRYPERRQFLRVPEVSTLLPLPRAAACFTRRKHKYDAVGRVVAYGDGG